MTLVHRRDELRAEKIMQERLFKHPKVEVIWDSVTEEVLGDDMGVTGVRLKNVKSGETSEISCDGFFVAIGHDPATKPFAGRQGLPPGRDGGWHGLHGRPRSREVAGGPGGRRGRRGGVIKG